MRTLACRGHASHDAQACVAAALGRCDEVPHSPGHRLLRALVQNAMQSSLRSAGLAWGLYELNQALVIAADHPNAEAAWLAGEDVLAPAALHEVPVDGNEIVMQGLVKAVDPDTGRVTVDVTTTCGGDKVLGRCIAVVRLD